MLGLPLPLDRTTSLSALLLNDTVKEQKLQEEVPLISHELPVATSPADPPMSLRIQGQERRRGLGKRTGRDTAFGVILGERVCRERGYAPKIQDRSSRKHLQLKIMTHITCARSTGRSFALCAGRSRRTDT